MDTWKPVELCQCVGSPILGMLIAVLSLGVLFWYTLIGIRWLETARASSQDGKSVWYYLFAVFFVCAMSGYLSPVIAFFDPRTAITLRVVSLGILNIICPLFLKSASKFNFSVLGKYENIGSEITKAVNSVDELNDRELASLARKLVAAGLERQSISEGVH